MYCVCKQAMSWAPGGMRCGIATGSGKIIFGSVLDLEEQNGNTQVRLNTLLDFHIVHLILEQFRHRKHKVEASKHVARQSYAHSVEHSTHLQVCLTDVGTVDVSDVATGATESLEFSEPVEVFALGHRRLLVATGSQVRDILLTASVFILSLLNLWSLCCFITNYDTELPSTAH